MIVWIVGGLFLAAVAYFATPRLTHRTRLMVALAVFIVMVVLPLLWLLHLGDRPAEGTQVVTPDMFRKAAESPPPPATPPQ